MSIRKLTQTAAPLDDPSRVQALDPKLLDMSIMGVPDAQARARPTSTSFPKKFNPDAMKVWMEMFLDPEFQQEMIRLPRTEAAWNNAVVEFIRRCEAAGVPPFGNASATVKNEYIFDFVNRARILVVRYFDEIGMFERVKVRKALREYQRSDKGMTFVTWAELFPIREPLEDFEAWLVQTPLPRFHKVGTNTYTTRKISPHILVWARVISQQRVTVGFNIEVQGTVAIPDSPVPKRSEVDRYVDQTIWLPIVRAHRISAIKNRLF